MKPAERGASSGRRAGFREPCAWVSRIRQGGRLRLADGTRTDASGLAVVAPDDFDNASAFPEYMHDPLGQVFRADRTG